MHENLLTKIVYFGILFSDRERQEIKNRIARNQRQQSQEPREPDNNRSDDLGKIVRAEPEE